MITDFENLPSEIKYHIISFFDSYTTHNFAYVNKLWHSNEDTWKSLCEKKGIKQNEGQNQPTCWKQLFLENATYVQVIEGWHSKSEIFNKRDSIPLHRICMLGTGGVGLTAIIRQFLFKELFLKYDPTVEDTYFGQIIVNGERRNLEIMDTAGQEEYSALRHQYIRSYRIFAYVFSVTSASTFQAIDKLIMKSIEEHGETQIYGILIGNKVDLKNDRTVSREDGEMKAKRWGMRYMETTIFDRRTILDAFAVLLKNDVTCSVPISSKKKSKKHKKLDKLKGCIIL